MLSVTYFYREPRKTGLSIEGIFKLVENCLKNKVNIKSFYCDGTLSRIQNTKNAGRHADEINHITGDVNFLALGLRGRKNILTVHDLGHYDTLRPNFIKFLVYKWFWYKLPLRYIDVVTVVSTFTKNKLMEYTNFPEDRIVLIPDPVKPLFKFVKKEAMNNKPSILMMGTGRHKNLGNLIEAVKGTDYHLDIVGWPSAEEEEKLKSYNIHYTLYNKLSDQQVYERFIACDIMYNASFYEGFGMPIIEAQSVGRPVITSNAGAMKEVAGDTAMLVNPDQPEEIRKAIDALVNDRELYDHMVERGRSNAKQYNYEVIAENYYNVYKNLQKQ